MKLSIIVPCYNEEKNIRDFYDYFIKENSIDEYELIFVDDFSNDASLKVYKKIIKVNSKVKGSILEAFKPGQLPNLYHDKITTGFKKTKKSLKNLSPLY